jgi:hypothetical protein
LAYVKTDRKQEGLAEMTKARALQRKVLAGQMEVLSRDCGDSCGQPAISHVQ